MDNHSLKDSGKKTRDFDSARRFEYLSAVEWATKQMILRLETYVTANKKGPDVIAVRADWYQPSECLSGLRMEVERRGLTSKIVPSTNGTFGDLNFDLDEIADQYFDRQQPMPTESSSHGLSHPYCFDSEEGPRASLESLKD
jgi:hypothetical protein